MFDLTNIELAFLRRVLEALERLPFPPFDEEDNRRLASAIRDKLTDRNLGFWRQQIYESGNLVVRDDEMLDLEMRFRGARAVLLRASFRGPMCIDNLRVDSLGSGPGPNQIGVNNPFEIVAWRTIEEITAWVAGDGTDAQRVALADGILAGRR